ncbi:4Fe-4S binding protein [Clostridium grantii]|uniref:4Fe-4S binding domain-containing protein n=1 Tax=Clostridium grantii DSM 8605 TaxID=1121316 RepID=A0A1M5RT85_9CLOT|nr:4Fe-4S binding protein [Clostridium grantii]SHH29542.1 4Fe-4S binding domain-containing protein [Clostridium grantii DSM 8605]
MKKRKSHQSWSWIFMVLFILLSILDIRFGILGFICMTMPMYHAIKGRGKIHCSHYCPRGSILQKFLKEISFNNTLPTPFRKHGKKVLITIMIILFSFSMYHAGPNIYRIGFALFRFMTASFALGIIMGVIFKPRSWCQVCPMGYAAELITKAKKAA